MNNSGVSLRLVSNRDGRPIPQSLGFSNVCTYEPLPRVLGACQHPGVWAHPSVFSCDVSRQRFYPLKAYYYLLRFSIANSSPVSHNIEAIGEVLKKRRIGVAGPNELHLSDPQAAVLWTTQFEFLADRDFQTIKKHLPLLALGGNWREVYRPGTPSYPERSLRPRRYFALTSGRHQNGSGLRLDFELRSNDATFSEPKSGTILVHSSSALHKR